MTAAQRQKVNCPQRGLQSGSVVKDGPIIVTLAQVSDYTLLINNAKRKKSLSEDLSVQKKKTSDTTQFYALQYLF